MDGRVLFWGRLARVSRLVADGEWIENCEWEKWRKQMKIGKFGIALFDWL
jgi:hypothetical protein